MRIVTQDEDVQNYASAFPRTHCIGGILKMSNFNEERATTLTSADRIKVLIIDDSLISRDRRRVVDAFFCSLRSTTETLVYRGDKGFPIRRR